MQFSLSKNITYLSHVADYNGHDDPIDCYSFTKDDTRGRL